MKREFDEFQRLYYANYERIRRLLARTAGEQEADDLAQVVFYKAARELSKFRGDAKISTWLYRIAANVASDWIRGRSTLEARATVQFPDGREDALCDSSVSSASPEKRISPERELIREEMGDCIRRVIGQLPDKHRTVLVLSEFGGLKDEEIARTLGINLGNAKVRLHRARAQLKQALETHCEFFRDEDNEFVCEPKESSWHATSKRLDCSSTAKSNNPSESEAS